MNKIFNADNIVLNKRLRNKEDAIDVAGKVLVEQGYVDPKYVECMHKREEVISTYIGNNVAIPHGIDCYEKYIKESGISFIQVPEGVNTAMTPYTSLWVSQEKTEPTWTSL